MTKDGPTCWILHSTPGRRLVIAFGGAKADRLASAIADLRHAFPCSLITGCSTAGEILGTEIHDQSLVVAVVRFSTTTLRDSNSVITDPRQSFDAGRRIAERLSDPDLRGVLVFSEGVNVNGSVLADGINSSLPHNIPVTGGLAGDGERFEKTWVLHDGHPCSRCIGAVGFYGKSLRFGFGSKGGWDIFGPDRRVTRAEGNIVYELDGRPALDLYKEYLGDLARGLPATGLRFPLSVRDEASGLAVVRTILGIDEARSALIFAGDVPTGSLARLMRASFERLVDGADEAARLALQASGAERAELAIIVSCVGRRMVMGDQTEDEIETVANRLGTPHAQIGFYSYGELTPLGLMPCSLHNQTLTLTTLSEA